MSRTLLLVGTRKGLFMLESDADRKNWSMRGAYCEGWPVYHAVFDQDSGAIYAAASDWHGSSIWRSADLGQDLERFERGSRLRGWPQDVQGFEPRPGSSRPRARRCGGAGHLRVATRGRRRLRTRCSPASPEARSGTIRRTSRPATLGSRRSPPTRTTRPTCGRSCRASACSRQQTTARRGRRETAVCAPTGRAEHEEVGFCVHKFVRSRTDEQRMYQQNHVGMHRSDDAGATWTEITEGLPTEFGFAAAAHPHDRDTFHVIPLDPGHGRTMPDGQAAVWRTRDAGSSWERLANGLPQENAHLGVLRHGMTGDTYDTPGYYFGTSTGEVTQVRTTGNVGARSRATCPRSRRSRSRSSTDGRHPPASHADAALRGATSPPRPRGGDGRRRDRPTRRAVAGIARPAVRPERRAYPAAHSRLRRS